MILSCPSLCILRATPTYYTPSRTLIWGLKFKASAKTALNSQNTSLSRVSNLDLKDTEGVSFFSVGFNCNLIVWLREVLTMQREVIRHLTLIVTSAQDVKTSVNITDNSPFWNYFCAEDPTTPSTVNPDFKISLVSFKNASKVTITVKRVLWR